VETKEEDENKNVALKKELSIHKRNWWKWKAKWCHAYSWQ